jgi:hypothetical protein
MQMLKRFVIVSLIVLTSSFSYSRHGFISDRDISSLEKSGHIVKISHNVWKTRGGLLISGTDPDKMTRLEHIMKHTIDMPQRPVHGVFTINKAAVIELMDETWSKIQSGSLKGDERSGKIAYKYDTGRVIGYMGGKKGRDQHNPRLKQVLMVIKKKRPEVITFFPQ